MTRWRLARWRDLSIDDVHDLFALRVAVFVVEQECAYQDVDGADPRCAHVLAHDDDELVAAARLVPPGVGPHFPDTWAIGRVVTAPTARGRGLGRDVMEHAIAHVETLAPGEPMRVAAQCYLQKFYESLGFERCSDDYDEDGIPHLDMERAAS